jgi:hypothetical protein
MTDEDEYDVSVFINCPFSDDYVPVFRAIVFAVVDCGYRPRCALEFEDSGEYRLNRINALIEASRYGIHDISNMTLDPEHNLPHFNMPFELGLFFGAKRYSQQIRQSEKVSLILDIDKWRHQKAMSDIAGREIESHDGNPETAILRVRNWLNSQPGRRDLPGAERVHERYRQYENDLPDICGELHLKPTKLTYVDLWRTMVFWQARAAHKQD